VIAWKNASDFYERLHLVLGGVSSFPARVAGILTIRHVAHKEPKVLAYVIQSLRIVHAALGVNYCLTPNIQRKKQPHPCQLKIHIFE
jgi:hypothetical protein